MAAKPQTQQQLVDWSAALWAGIAAGTLFLGLLVFAIPMIYGGNAWIFIRYIASIGLGPDVLPPPATYDPLVAVVGIVIHYALSIVFAMILAFITHRWGFLIGILVGSAFGAAIYGINAFAMTLVFTWFAILQHPAFLVLHILFGAVAGAVYEGLEQERFVRSQQDVTKGWLRDA